MIDQEILDEAKEERQQAAQDLYFWQHGKNFFTCKVFALIAAADRSNKEKIRLAFPVEVEVFEDWHSSRTEDAFYHKWGIR